MTPTKLAYTAEEVAVVLGIGRTTVYRLLAEGQIPSFTVGASRRVPVDGLEDFIAARMATEATADTG